MRRAAGEYIHPIVVQRNTEAPNDAGQLLPTVATVCSRYARIDTTAGTEITLPEGDQNQAQRTVKLCVPYDSVTKTITARMNVTHDGRTFEITAARDVDGRREEIQLTCLEAA